MIQAPGKAAISSVPEAEQRLLAAAERRIGLFILALIAPGAAAAWLLWTPEVALAFAIGGGLAYGNYRWLAWVVGELARAHKVKPGMGDYVKLLAPLILLTVILYVIFFVSPVPFVGVVSGVLLLVPAVILEAVVQAVLALRK